MPLCDPKPRFSVNLSSSLPIPKPHKRKKPNPKKKTEPRGLNKTQISNSMKQLKE